MSSRRDHSWRQYQRPPSPPKATPPHSPPYLRDFEGCYPGRSKSLHHLPAFSTRSVSFLLSAEAPFNTSRETRNAPNLFKHASLATEEGLFLKSLSPTYRALPRPGDARSSGMNSVRLTVCKALSTAVNCIY